MKTFTMALVKTTILLLGTLLIIFPGPTFADQAVIKFNLGTDPSALKSKAGAYFKRLVEQRSANRVQLEIVHDATPKSSGGLMDAFTNDRFQMAAPDIRILAGIHPQLKLFDLPFLFKSTAHLHRVIDGQIGEQLLKETRNKKLFALFFWDKGLMQMAANRALLTPEQGLGLKFAITGSKLKIDQFNHLGFHTYKCRTGQLYTNLKNGTLDCHETTLTTFYNQGLDSVQSDLTLTEHSFTGYLIVASTPFWEQLPADLKVIVQGAIREAADYTREMAREADRQAFEQISTTGKTALHRLTPDQRKRWRQRFRKIYPRAFDRIDSNLVLQTLKQ
ncbi:MAG: DctP family TRAP transporter solute-binding subunit [Geopsychrobacter sp.]|nr:DctP family TRAP transporter solute-binding subunit [Geopsychrobacter sp.]